MSAGALRVADECWIALALLTRENPDRQSFSPREVLERIRREHIWSESRAGLQAHIYHHNVANRAPSTARYRMFYRLEDGSLRLHRPGDVSHPDRAGKTYPRRSELPAVYHSLLDWYEQVYSGGETATVTEEDPIRGLRGLGKEIWRDTDADAWVNTLRASWDATDSAAHEESSSESAELSSVWHRIVQYQGSEFKTRTNLPFTYEIEGGSGIWFYRDGKRIEHRLWRGELEAAWKKGPLRKTTDLKMFQCPSYLYGLLTDPRISG